MDDGVEQALDGLLDHGLGFHLVMHSRTTSRIFSPPATVDSQNSVRARIASMSALARRRWPISCTISARVTICSASRLVMMSSLRSGVMLMHLRHEQGVVGDDRLQHADLEIRLLLGHLLLGDPFRIDRL